MATKWNVVFQNNPKGNWNANTNTPTLADGIGTLGDYYDVTTGGTIDLGSGSITFEASDIVKYNGTIWYKLDSPHAPNATTKLAITGDIAAGTTLSVTASGVNYTKSLNDGDLSASASAFELTEKISFNITGVIGVKGGDVTWVSQTSFSISYILHAGDIIIILS